MLQGARPIWRAAPAAHVSAWRSRSGTSDVNMADGMALRILAMWPDHSRRQRELRWPNGHQGLEADTRLLLRRIVDRPCCGQVFRGKQRLLQRERSAYRPCASTSHKPRLSAATHSLQQLGLMTSPQRRRCGGASVTLSALLVLGQAPTCRVAACTARRVLSFSLCDKRFQFRSHVRARVAAVRCRTDRFGLCELQSRGPSSLVLAKMGGFRNAHLDARPVFWPA